MEAPENETLEEKKAREKKIHDATTILSKVKDALKDLGDSEEDLDLDKFLNQLGISLDDYGKSLKISSRGNTIILKRKK